MQRKPLFVVFLVLLGVAFWATCGEAPPVGPMSASLEKVTDGVWFRLGERDQGHCNNIIIEMENYLIIIDANFPSGANLVIDDVKTVSNKPVKYVFDTHHHGDHAYGNPVWTAAGATTLAYVGVAEEIRRYEPAGWQSASEQREDVRVLGLDTLEPPKETFSDLPFVLEDSSRRVEFHHFGWAHTRGDGLAYLPNEKILASGDAIVNGAFNFTGQGNTGNWPSVIRKATMELDVEQLLPGHGSWGGSEIMQGQLAFFEELNAAVEAAFEAKTPLEEIVTVEDGAGVSTTIELSAAVQNWVGDRFAEQVRVRYAELAEGKPHGSILTGD